MIDILVENLDIILFGLYNGGSHSPPIATITEIGF